MRIAIVSPYDLSVPGGVQAQVLGLAARLDERGHDVVVVGDAPRRVLRLPVNGSVAPLVMDRLGDPNADAVHIHEPITPLGWRALGAGGATVVTFHAAVTPRLAGWIRRLGPLLVGRLAQTTATAVSDVAAAPWRAIGLVPAIIPNGVAPPRPSSVPRDPRRVVFVGRDDPRKGLGVLRAAWQRVHRRLPDTELVVVGADGADAPGVRYLGRVDEATKWATLAAAGVACLPNLGNESFGIVGTEAMAAGCAVVASDLPAFRAVIGDAGRYAPPGDVAALTDRLIRVLGDHVLQSEMREAGVIRAERYGWDRVVDAYLETYETAVAERRLNRR